MITGLVMVWIWCSSCLRIKVFCSGTQNYFEIPNTSNSQRIRCSYGSYYFWLCMLLKNCRYSSTVTASFPNPCDKPVGQICFSVSRNNNYKIRSLFIENLISAPHVIYFFKYLFDNLNWKKVWLLQQKFFLTNMERSVF